MANSKKAKDALSEDAVKVINVMIDGGGPLEVLAALKGRTARQIETVRVEVARYFAQIAALDKVTAKGVAIARLDKIIHDAQRSDNAQVALQAQKELNRLLALSEVQGDASATKDAAKRQASAKDELKSLTIVIPNAG